MIVKREIIKEMGIGKEGLKREEEEKIEEIQEMIQEKERREMMDESEKVDRMIENLIEQNIGEEYEGRVKGVKREGMLVNIEKYGEEGMVKI